MKPRRQWLMVRLKRNAIDETPTREGKAAVVKAAKLSLHDYTLAEVLSAVDDAIAAADHARFWDSEGRPFDVEPARWDHVSVIVE